MTVLSKHDGDSISNSNQPTIKNMILADKTSLNTTVDKNGK